MFRLDYTMLSCDQHWFGLALFAFEIQLKLSDAALRIEVNVDAVDLQSPPGAHVHSCLQKHITKLQVNRPHIKWLPISTFWRQFNWMVLACWG